MLLLPLKIIVPLFEISMTVEILYNVDQIEYSFIDIASIKMHQHICASTLTLLVLSTLPRYNSVVDVTSLIKRYLVTITTIDVEKQQKLRNKRIQACHHPHK